MKKLGVLPGFKLLANRVLVGCYKRPTVTKSGIHLADATLQEEKFQGKAALVLLKGRSAFVSDSTYDFGGDNVEVGEWISLWVTDGRSIMVNGHPCRIIRDQDINMVIPAPDQIF